MGGSSVFLTLGQRQRRWPNVEETLDLKWMDRDGGSIRISPLEFDRIHSGFFLDPQGLRSVRPFKALCARASLYF